MKQKIILTRPEAQANNFLKRLFQFSLDLEQELFFKEPLLEIETFNVDLDCRGCDALIITSGHAVGDIVLPAELPVYCVGQHTASLMCSSCVYHAQDVQSLIAKIGSQCSHKRFLYLRGAEVSHDIAGILNIDDFKVDEITTYRARKVDSFSDDFIRLLKNEDVSAITFFSKRTAEHFLDLVNKHQLFMCLSDINALCISKSVLECVHSVFGERALVSQTPDFNGMAKLIRSSTKTD